MKPKIEVMFIFLLEWMYSDRRGTDKNNPGQNLPDNKDWTKPPVKNLCELRQTSL